MLLYRARLCIAAAATSAREAKQPPQLLLFFTRRSASSSSSSLLSISPTSESTHRDRRNHQTINLKYCCCWSPPYTIPTSPISIDRNLLHRSSNLLNLSQVKRSHALLLVGGFFRSITTAIDTGAVLSQLVHAYVKFGALEEALLVFHQLPHHNHKKNNNNIAWNAILRGFVDAGLFSDAVDFYHLMITQHHVVPDNFTYPLILKACSGISALELGREVVESIQFNETKPNIYVECAAIDMFAKCGSLEEARMLFEDMPKKDLASWTAMICGALRNGDWLEGLRLFRRMISLEQRIRPDSTILAAVLPACSRLEARQMGMTLQGCAIRNGFEADLYVSNALVDMYCKCGDTSEANRIFSNMVYKDVVSWGTLIAGYAQNCQYHQSVELYLKMKSSGITTTVVTAASVLPGFAKLKLLKQGKEMHNYILKQGFESDIVVGSALIDMYTNCGSKREAEHLFEIMSDRDITIWNSIIVGHASDEDFDSAFRIFRRLWNSRLKPNSITLISILPVCTKMGAVKQGNEIHGYAVRSSLGQVVSVGNSLIDMYCKCGYLDLGVKVFDQMLEKNIVTYNTIISAHGIHGQAQLAFSLFDKMKKANIKPNKVTFTGLLSTCSHAGLIDRGWSLYNSMRADYHLLPDMAHYSCMVDLLGRAGQLGDACNFIKKMSVEPDINILGSLLGACRAHSKVELADNLIGRKIFHKKLMDSGYHILLSNIYASIERWEDASKVRTMMKEKGLIKKPGKSWIQIGGWVYTFHATDTMHPVFHKIQETLESLLLEMKNEGYIYSEP